MSERAQGIDRQARSDADWTSLGVVCPSCRAPLAQRPEGTFIDCAGCGSAYPVVGGIPDLRTIGDPYLSRAEDEAAARRLLAADPALDFLALYASYYEGNAKVPAAQVAQFTHGVAAASSRASATLQVWSALGVAPPAGSLVIDLGCGTAPLGVLLARAGHRVIAVDAGLRWLVMARRRAAQEGVDLPVLCANAEQLPFASGTVALVAGESVLENVTDASAALTEVHRVSRSGGWIALTTPNRLSLGPDPHLGLMAGGWRSEASLRSYAERTGKVFPRRRLFAPGELKRALRSAGFVGPRVTLPYFTPAQRSGLSAPAQAAVAAYHLVRALPVARQFLLQVAPTLVAAATRP